MKGLYKFTLDCGRMGTLDGLFIAERAAVEGIIGKTVYFGEVLGKHSEIEATIDRSEIELKSNDVGLIAQLESMFQRATLCGHNPFDYYDPA